MRVQAESETHLGLADYSLRWRWFAWRWIGTLSPPPLGRVFTGQRRSRRLVLARGHALPSFHRRGTRLFISAS